jgi:hypothetical protein
MWAPQIQTLDGLWGQKAADKASDRFLYAPLGGSSGGRLPTSTTAPPPLLASFSAMGTTAGPATLPQSNGVM